MANILVTCAGSGVGQSALDSLNLVNKHYVIGCDAKKDVYAFNYCNKFYEVPSIYSTDYTEKIIEICKKEKIDVVIPGHDGELLIFAKKINLFDKNNIKVIVSKPDIIEISRDKYRWFKYFSDKGCSIVNTKKISDFVNQPDMDFFPAIVKPSGGSASQGISIIKNISELSEHNFNADYIIQPYLFPEKVDQNYDTIKRAVDNKKLIQLSEISIQIIYNTDSTIKSIFISKNILKNGVPMFVEPIEIDSFKYSDEILKFAKTLSDEKVIGPVNLQGRVTENGFVFFEMNMRFTGITGTRAKLGWNEVEYLVSNFLGKESYLDKFASNKYGIRQVACDTAPIQSKRDKKFFTILGFSGFIGSNFVKKLLEINENCIVQLIYSESEGDKNRMFFKDDPRVCFISSDDNDIASYYSLTDILINFVGARANESDSRMYNAINFLYKQVKIIAKIQIPFILNISSQSIYNQKEDSIKTEIATPQLDNAYAFQKYMTEEFFNSIAESKPSIHVLNLRLSRVFNTYKSEGFFAHIIESFLNGQSITIPNPQNKINLVDIRDVVDAILYFTNFENKNILPKVINIGNKNYSIIQYAETVLEIINKKNSRDLIISSNNSNISISSMINTELARSLGWKPKYTLESSIKKLIEKF